MCVQMLQRVIMLAAESLKVLEHQLIDGSQKQDVRVGEYCLHDLSTICKWIFAISVFSCVLCISVGDFASSSGRLRCCDSPKPKAGPPARPGSRSSGHHLQQGRDVWQCGSAWRAPSSHRLQPCVPLPGRAKSE